MQNRYDRDAILAFLGVPTPGADPKIQTETERAGASRMFADRPMTVNRIIGDCHLATSSASLAGFALGAGEQGTAARFCGLSLALLEALVIDGCNSVDGADEVPVMVHRLAETCQAHWILEAAVFHAKGHLARWGKL